MSRDNQLKRQIDRLPKGPGVYQFFDNAGKLLYVGKSIAIKKRVASYFVGKSLGPKTDLLISKIYRIDYTKVFSEFEALLLESELIKKNQPFFNSISKDDKSPIYIKITKDAIPLIGLVRKPKIEKGVAVYGPFPTAKVASDILKTIRKIFPYCHHKNPKKPCLYVHLGLCPYPDVNLDSIQNYTKNIRKIKKLLSGKIKSLIKLLTDEMKNCAALQKYEEANVAKKQIEKLQLLTTTYHAPAEFLAQPTLVDDLTAARLKNLKDILVLPKIPERIECYDISNIQGNLATGSMVTFTEGKADKGQYRRFKIKFTHKPNDYEMLREVLARRIKNDWQKPDLMIIDGGRGQLNAVLAIITKYKVNTFVISLAKRLEQIFTQGKVSPISLPKENPARQLAQQIRDEAHRFALSYHRLLRSKQLLQS